jgi:hypothetical protein
MSAICFALKITYKLRIEELSNKCAVVDISFKSIRQQYQGSGDSWIHFILVTFGVNLVLGCKKICYSWMNLWANLLLFLMYRGNFLNLFVTLRTGFVDVTSRSKENFIKNVWLSIGDWKTTAFQPVIMKHYHWYKVVLQYYNVKYSNLETRMYFSKIWFGYKI